MRNFAAIVVLAIIFGMPEKNPDLTIFLAGDSTMAIKDPGVYPEIGWGMPFVQFWDSTVRVVNMAKNGRSTKTFISEGLWKSIRENIKNGDYVVIQFGHNDEAPTKLSYTPADSFKLNLIGFIQDVKEKGGHPVLCTPVSRRKFDSNGNTLETHPYTSLVKEVAANTSVAFIDLDSLSRELYQKFGPEHSRWLFLQLQPGEHPNYPEGKIDNTHFNELGARLIAQIIFKEMIVLFPDLKGKVIKKVKN